MSPQPYIVGEDRESGEIVVLRLCPSRNHGTKRRPLFSWDTYIPLEIRSSPFFKNVRVVRPESTEERT